MRSPAEPTNARGRRTRRALLTAARELVERDGLDALTMAAVADRAGCSRRAVYLHFSTRTELLLALFAHVAEVEDLTGSLAPVRAEPDPVRKLDEWARHLARYIPRVRAMAHAVDALARTDPDAGERHFFARRGQYDDAREIVIALHEANRLVPTHTVDSATDLLYALSGVELFDRLTADRGWPPERYAEQLGALLRASLVAGAG